MKNNYFLLLILTWLITNTTQAVTEQCPLTIQFNDNTTMESVLNGRTLTQVTFDYSTREHENVLTMLVELLQSKNVDQISIEMDCNVNVDKLSENSIALGSFSGTYGNLASVTPEVKKQLLNMHS